VAWGDNSYGQTNVPITLTNAQAVACGRGYSVALKGDGTVIAWGRAGMTNVPAGLGNVVAIAAGNGQTLALKRDGTLSAWGLPDTMATTNLPVDLTNVLAISCGDDHNLVLKADRTLYAWGANYSHQTNIPPDLTNVVAIAAGDSANIAVKGDGTLWVSGAFYSTNLLTGSNFVAAALVAGSAQGAFISCSGIATIWGYNNSTSDTNVADVVAVAGRSAFNQAGATWALRRDGTLAGFGASYLGQSNVWMNLSNVLAIAPGYGHHLAIVGDTLPTPIEPLAGIALTNGQFAIQQPTSVGRAYRLEYQDTLNADWQMVPPAPGNGEIQTLADPHPAPMQRFYRVSAR